MKFVFDNVCLKTFEYLKEKLTSTPFIVSYDWSMPFEIRYDASGVVLEAVLGQRCDKILHPIYCASKALNTV